MFKAGGRVVGFCNVIFLFLSDFVAGMCIYFCLFLFVGTCVFLSELMLFFVKTVIILFFFIKYIPRVVSFAEFLEMFRSEAAESSAQHGIAEEEDNDQRRKAGILLCTSKAHSVHRAACGR